MYVSRTLFTGLYRHTYIDPDYAHTDDQREVVQHNKDFYAAFINSLRNMRYGKLSTMCDIFLLSFLYAPTCSLNFWLWLY